MARKFSELRNKMSAEALARSNAKAAKLRSEMALDELRAALNLTQVHLAKLLRIQQGAVSKMERRTDMYVSTLSDFVEAMGGKLEITASFPEGRVKITQFRALRDSAKGEKASEDESRDGYRAVAQR